MEKYIAPAIELLEFSEDDVITTSLTVGGEGEAGTGPEQEWPGGLQWGDDNSLV